MIQAITDRRSVRKYQDRTVPRSMIEEIIRAGILAPSAKNRQPWKFVVVTKGAREEMLAALVKGLERERREPFLAKSACYLDSAEYTFSIMKQAPVVIFIINPLAKELQGVHWEEAGEMKCPLAADIKAWEAESGFSEEDRIAEICNTQSIGAAIENMVLTATDLGLGSLWICDTFFVQRELDEWLGAKGELFAALAIGFADEAPNARPRKDFKDVVEWWD